MKKNKILNLISTFLFYISILFFFVGFNFQDSRTGGWVQQFMPSLPGNPGINDITFADSLTGFAVTAVASPNSYILKTTNGGLNWNIVMTRTDGTIFSRVNMLNKDTVYCAGDFFIFKTTNSGLNWQTINVVSSTFAADMFVLNTDTLWYASSGTASFGGLFRTTNGGINWQVQYNVAGSGNPNKIYMYNARIGFMSAGGQFFRTMNSGVNWTQIPGENDYNDIYFIDSLRGYKAKYIISKTTNGGLNWQDQIPPVVPGISTSNQISKFSYINDTLYGVWGSVTYPNFHTSAIVYKTTNGGANWGYQIPDTSYNIGVLHFTKFINSKKGWCYINNGIFTRIGGDSTIMAGINSISNIISNDYSLYQNYPNPFNPISNIKYKIEKMANIKIIVFDITGKEITTLVNKKQTTGIYDVKFDGSNLSSGVYFYTLFVDGIRIDTKKMALIK